MKLTIIEGDGNRVRRVGHLQDLNKVTSDVERYLKNGLLLLSRVLVKNLTPIERSVVATRLLRDGISVETVVEVLA